MNTFNLINYFHNIYESYLFFKILVELIIFSIHKIYLILNFVRCIHMHVSGIDGITWITNLKFKNKCN